MRQYLSLAHHVLTQGDKRMDRTGTGTYSSFGHRLEFDLRDGFPLLTTKKMWYKGILIELLWMLRGETSADYMLENGVHIWDEWMNEDRDLGPVYGVQWRQWLKHLKDGDVEFVDQLQNAIASIRNNPTDRRMVVTAWNPGELDEMALPPCHMFYQFYVEGEFLDVQVYQRSADVFLGLPFDIASYATLLSMVAYVTGKTPRRLIYILGDTHIYTNHVEQVLTQLRREPMQLPRLLVNAEAREIKEIDDFKFEDFALVGYESHGLLKGKVSV